MNDAPIVGFRTWLITTHEPDLKSVAMNHVWPKQQDVIAKCMRNVGFMKHPSDEPEPKINLEHEPPTEGCQCGLYARTTLDGVKDEYPYYPVHGYWAYMRPTNAGLMIMGAVLMWGTVHRGGKVIKAARARVLCLTDIENPWVERTGSNNPASVPEERREERKQTVNMIAEAYGVPIIPYASTTMYASEFGDLTPKPE